MKPTLLLLAAGMGSRYGGLKQSFRHISHHLLRGMANLLSDNSS